MIAEIKRKLRLSKLDLDKYWKWGLVVTHCSHIFVSFLMLKEVMKTSDLRNNYFRIIVLKSHLQYSADVLKWQKIVIICKIYVNFANCCKLLIQLLKIVPSITPMLISILLQFAVLTLPSFKLIYVRYVGNVYRFLA